MRKSLLETILALLMIASLTSCGIIIPKLPNSYNKISNSSKEKIYFYTDEYTNVTDIRHKDLYKKAPIEIYISEAKTYRNAYIRFQYIGDDWIFMNKVHLLSKKEKVVGFGFDYSDVGTDVASFSTGVKVTEVITISLPEYKIKELTNIIADEKDELRLEMTGKYKAYYIIKGKKLKALQDMLNFHNGTYLNHSK